jgi:ABC-type phosphate transport system ATPase subunit
LSGSLASRLNVENPIKRKNSNTHTLLEEVGISENGMFFSMSDIPFIDEGSVIEKAATEQFFRNPSHPRKKLFLSKILWAEDDI